MNNTDETISGVKTFSRGIIRIAPYPGIDLICTRVDDGVLGRRVAIENDGPGNRLVIYSQNGVNNENRKAIFFRFTSNAASGAHALILNVNATTDANGFIKSASPILRLANSAESMPENYFDGFESAGCGAVNDEAVGAIAERNDTGVYRVMGSLGLADDGWTIEVPQDINGNRLCFVETETAQNGDIIVHVSKRRFDIETGNIVAGEPMDIPDGRWIDLRLSMPATLEHAYSNSDSNNSDDNVSSSTEPVI